MANTAKKNVKSTSKKENAKAVKNAKKVSVKRAEKKTNEVVKEKVTINRSYKWNYPADCTSTKDRKVFRTQLRAKIAKWDKLLESEVNAKGTPLKKKELRAIKAEKREFLEKWANKNYSAAKQWVS